MERILWVYNTLKRALKNFFSYTSFLFLIIECGEMIMPYVLSVCVRIFTLSDF